eukprot:sb/3469561/
MLRFLVLSCVALVVAVHAAEKAYCTAGQKNVEAPEGSKPKPKIYKDFPGYYRRPIPGNCRGRHGNMNGWKPQHKIRNPISSCPREWKKFGGACYWEGRRHRGHKNYRHAEEECNGRKAHIFMPNRREEWDWVTQNMVSHRNEHYWIGIFCSNTVGTTEFKSMFTVTREDMRIIAPRLHQFAMLITGIDNHKDPVMAFRLDQPKTGRQWNRRQGPEGGHGWICEAPLA